MAQCENTFIAVETVNSLIKHMNAYLQKYVLFSHSFGSVVQFSLRHNLHPQWARSILFSRRSLAEIGLHWTCLFSMLGVNEQHQRSCGEPQNPGRAMPVNPADRSGL